ncbi:MAG: MarR family transcriptional regulator [Anaerolineales bacterium]|nr:MarR family transcriptional regulator [Anaerolineales bacterium]
MDTGLADFIRAKQIDSFSKLRFLLFLRQHPHLRGGVQQLAERMYIEAPLVEKMIADLQGVGLLEGEKNDYILPDEPSLKLCLENLARTFEQPLTRQELLEQIKQRPTPKMAPKPRSKLSTLKLQKTTVPA